MNAAAKPDRFKTQDEFLLWMKEYGAAWRAKNRERQRLVEQGLAPRRYKSHEKKRR